MPVVSNTEKDPAGAPHRNALVHVRLVAALVGAYPGYVSGSDFSIIGEWSTRTDATGDWSVDLVANELISPADTYYQADVQPKVGYPVRHEFAVPNGAGPYRVEDILTNPPSNLPVLHLLDPTDAHDASAISVVPGGTLAATNAQAALLELDAQDTAEATARAAADASIVIGAGADLAAETAARIAADTAEASARTAADSTLTTNLAAEVTNRTADVNAEETRALAAESVLTTGLANEVTARTAGDAAVTSAANAAVAAEATARTSADASEASARIAADSALGSNLTTETTNRIADVNAEETRALAAESALSSNLAAEVTNRTNAVSSEVTARSTADAAEASARAAADTTLTTNLAAEVSNRTGAVNAEQIRAVAAESVLAGDIAGLDADLGIIDTALAAEVTNRTSGDASIAASVATEVTNRTNADTAIAASVALETANRVTDVNTEETRALAAESALTAADAALATDVAATTAALATKQPAAGVGAGTLYVDDYIAAAGAATTTQITDAIQAALAAAKAAGKWCEFAPRAYSVNQTLDPTDTLIRAYGATITLAAGSNCYLLTATAGANVTIWGGIWDGNNDAGQQTTGVGFIGYGMYLVAPGPAALAGRVWLKDLEVHNCIKFAILVSAATEVLTDNIRFDTQSDGLHIHGPCPVFRSINGIGGTTGDDMVSCTTSDYPANVTTTGAFGTIEIDALYPVSAGPAFAALGSVAFPFPKITIKRIEGTVDTVAVRITNDPTVGADLNGTTVKSLTISHVEVDNFDSSSPIVNLAATEIQDARIDDLIHRNTQPVIIVDTAKVVRRLTVSGMRSQGSAVQPLVSILGTCEELIFEGITATLGAGGKLFQNNGTVNRAMISGALILGSTSGALLGQIAGAAPLDVFLNNVEIRGMTYGFIIGATAKVHLANVKFKDVAFVFYLNNAAAAVRVLAGVVVQDNVFRALATTAGATISANGEMMVMDASGADAINPVAGDRIFDRVSNKPVLYNGSAWVAAY